MGFFNNIGTNFVCESKTQFDIVFFFELNRIFYMLIFFKALLIAFIVILQLLKFNLGNRQNINNFIRESDSPIVLLILMWSLLAFVLFIDLPFRWTWTTYLILVLWKIWSIVQLWSIHRSELHRRRIVHLCLLWQHWLNVLKLEKGLLLDWHILFRLPNGVDFLRPERRTTHNWIRLP